MAKFTPVAQIDPSTHPLFLRIFGQEGFERLDSSSLERLSSAEGLQFVLFADDPNKQKETLDILVIGAELKKTLADALSGAWMTDTTEGRSLAARWGIRKLPAAALFRDGTYLGAVEGLSDWNDYLMKLAEIAERTQAPKRMISILPLDPQSPAHC